MGIFMGAVLMFGGFVALAFGAWNHVKAKRVLAAPFKAPSELAANPTSDDPKGAMSTEGTIVTPQVLLSPCTKQPCLAYEVKIERLFEKTETTQDGTKTVKGSDTLETVKAGSIFRLTDGQGSIEVDFTKGADHDSMKKGFDKSVNYSSTKAVHFGEFEFVLPALGGEGWTTGFKATETYVPAEGSLFVLGKLEGSRLVKPSWRSMMASPKGRDGLVGSLAKKKKFSLIGGAVAAVLALPIMIFGPKADTNAPSRYCKHELSGVVAACDSHTSSTSGETFAWNVAKAGTYAVKVSVPTNKKYTMLPQIVVKDAEGNELADAMTTAELSDLKPGAYTVTVRDDSGYMVKGGYDFSLAIDAAAEPTPVAEEAPVDVVGDDVVEPVKDDSTKLPVAAKRVAAAPKAMVKPQPKPVAKHAGKNMEN